MNSRQQLPEVRLRGLLPTPRGFTTSPVFRWELRLAPMPAKQSAKADFVPL